MNNPFDEIQAALSRSRELQRSADACAAGILIGRLRHVPAHLLVDLKHELLAFNAKTEKWVKA